MSSNFGGSYNHWRKSGPDEEWRGRNSEDVIGLNLEKGDRNRIQLFVVDGNAHLYVNLRRAGILNLALGDIPPAERIYLVVVDRDTNRYEYSLGGFTRFEDFVVWRWDPSLFDLPSD